jgi:DNA repair protein RadC
MNKELIYKLEQRGFDSLSDNEVLSVMAGTKTSNKFEKLDLRKLAKMSITELIAAGLTKRESQIVASAFEASRRRQALSALDEVQIRSSASVFEYFSSILSDLSHEEFHVMFLNRANRVIKSERISAGGVAGTVTDVRLILKSAIQLLASGIIISHNHPSGNTSPSDSDVRITQKIKEAGALIDVQLLDHIIVAGREYYSFADNGAL